ncbi:glycosyltransferase family 2 protein [Candidatus Uhrbacteria bacterium]|nr:glycosyltransferase family 2 protein [Candidatus Uhrbacteria bacterium]
MPRVSVIIVARNGMKFLPEVLSSLSVQEYRDFSVLIIDSGSSDGTVWFVRDSHPSVAVIRNSRNLGSARARNQGLSHVRAHLDPANGDPLILMLGQDVMADPEFLGNLVSEIDRHSGIGSVGGRILQATAGEEDGLRQVRRSDRFETTGLLAFPSGRFADRGAGQADDGSRFRVPGEVFGVSGQAALYRLKALDDVAYRDGTAYDEGFFGGWEDVDLAWRLRILGWRSSYAPEAVAYRFRTDGGGGRVGFLQSVRERRNRSVSANGLLSRNRLVTFLKNVHVKNFFRYFFPIFLGGLGKAVFFLFFEPRTALSCLSVFRDFPDVARKRRQVFGRTHVPPSEIGKWF